MTANLNELGQTENAVIPINSVAVKYYLIFCMTAHKISRF